MRTKIGDHSSLVVPDEVGETSTSIRVVPIVLGSRKSNSLASTPAPPALPGSDLR